MSGKAIRFELNEDEKKSEMEVGSDVVAYTFQLEDDGSLVVIEHWASNDEIYSDGIAITVRPRIWALALPWIIANSTPSK